MNEIVAFLASAVPPVALVVIPIVLIRALGPVDLVALYRAPRDDAWPTGLEEGEPRAWNLAAPRLAQHPGRIPRTA
jgi:hypothetical protein